MDDVEDVVTGARMYFGSGVRTKRWLLRQLEKAKSQLAEAVRLIEETL